MFGYYLQLAFRNLRRNPGLTALMIGAVALGIAVCVMTLTMYRAMSGNLIWWKNDVLYAVTMDFWDPRGAGLGQQARAAARAAHLPRRDGADRVRYPEAQGHHAQGDRRAGVDGRRWRPSARDARDDQGFFAMFDVPFQYGGGWTDAADAGPSP